MIKVVDFYINVIVDLLGASSYCQVEKTTQCDGWTASVFKTNRWL